jgi:beta-galactosidase
MKHLLATLLLLLPLAPAAQADSAPSEEQLLLTSWRFHLGAADGAEAADFDARSWTPVDLPHDWAIAGPFDKEIDKQVVAIAQNGEREATEKTGRSGSLPWIGEGWYRTTFAVPEGYPHVELLFDGAMSEPEVYVNGRRAGAWAYGYNSFTLDVSALVHTAGDNTLAVHLNNVPESSRWYPGAGLYRPVRLLLGQEVGIATWGTFVRTTALSPTEARIAVSTELRGTKPKQKVRLVQRVLSPEGKSVAEHSAALGATATVSNVLTVAQPQAWTPETPTLYTLETEVYDGDRLTDRQRTRFGIRTVEVSAAGFRLNGAVRKLKGVCLHHDLGPLGAAVHRDALARQILLLKEMGCDAIRTSHNMPAPWQMELCDSLGMMVMAESFDMWIYPKCKNGYSRFFADWWERDLTNLVRCHRNHPSIVMWSIGNEIPDQGSAEGLRYSRLMQELCHRLDPSRPVTQGLDRVDNALWSGVLQAMDVPGLNYRLPKYAKAYEQAPQGFLLGSETASTVSSRGVYKFPVVERKSYMYADGQCSGYDMECCSWSNLPDDDWQWQDDRPWVIGEFVWTGFDYLGEPSPYDEYWPSRSSYFGILDLAGLPKDRYYLYRSRWNPDAETLHLLPHWTWPGREGDTIPVYAYTNYPEAELFINGVSQGRRRKDPASRLDRYRLRWMETVYQPGTLKLVAYDAQGKIAAEEEIHTAGQPHHLVLTPFRPDAPTVDVSETTAPAPLRARQAGRDGTSSLAFVTVTVVDKDGNVCPDAALPLKFRTSGAVNFRAACNGDATSLEPFTQPAMQTFHGQLVVVVETGLARGSGKLTVSGSGVKSGSLTWTVE